MRETLQTKALGTFTKVTAPAAVNTLRARAAGHKGETLGQVYGRYSTDKAEAFDDCRRACYELGGHGLRICSASGWFFSVAFEFEANGTEYTALITKQGNRYFPR